MTRLWLLWDSSVGQKMIMAVTGLIMVAYLITHVLANLLVFQGPSKINAYSAFLHGTGGALWVARLVLLVALVLHVIAAVQLAARRQDARPVAYAAGRDPQVSPWASRTIRWGGALILAFLVYHILHFTIGTAHPDFVEGDPYHNVATGFHNPIVVLVYLVAMAAVGLHLYHGAGGGASVTRGVEQRPKSGDEPAGTQSPSAHCCPGPGAPHLAGLYRHPAGRVRRSCAIIELRSHSPAGPIEQKWDKHRFEMRLVNPANKRKYTILVVGSGLAGASAAASLSELGYNVKCFCFQDSPRRAHSIAAQGGINAAKNYRNDGDSVYRLFYDTVKGGDFRAREANVYRLAQISVEIIDQCVAQGVPFAREYSGYLDNRSFGGAQVSRTFYARGQTGQQLLLGAYQALERQIGHGTVAMYPRSEMLDLIVIDGKARGVVTRDLITGKLESHLADAVVLGTGGYGNVYYLSPNAKGSNTTAIWRAYKRGALFANPCFTQIHPTCIPVSGEYQSKLTLMSESLRNDGRVWVPLKKGDQRQPSEIPEADRDYYLERKYPSFGNLVPRDVASRNAKSVCDEGRGVGESGLAVYLDFPDAIARLGENTIKERYGNLFDMYERITGENPYKV